MDNSQGGPTRLVTIIGNDLSVKKAEEMVNLLVVNPSMDASTTIDMLICEKTQGGSEWGSGPPYTTMPNNGQFMGSTCSNDVNSMDDGMENEVFYCGKVHMASIIGQKGITINDIQKRSGCNIQIKQNVPAGQDCVVNVRGSRQDIENAREMLIDIIEMGSSHPYAGGNGVRYDDGFDSGDHGPFSSPRYSSSRSRERSRSPSRSRNRCRRGRSESRSRSPNHHHRRRKSLSHCRGRSESRVHSPNHSRERSESCSRRSKRSHSHLRSDDSSRRRETKRSRSRRRRRKKEKQGKNDSSSAEKANAQSDNDGSTKNERTILISQLVLRADKKDIHRYFRKKLGLEVNDVNLPRDEAAGGRHKGYATVELARVSDMLRSLDASNKVPDFQSFPISIKALEGDMNEGLSCNEKWY